MKFARITSMLLWVILAISSYFIVSLLINMDVNTSDIEMNKWINANLVWSYILIAICFGAALILEAIQIISDKKVAFNSLIVIALFGFIILISYILSDSDIPQFKGVDKFVADGTLTPTSSLWIGTGLIVSYILSAISIIGIIFTTISNFFK